MDYNHRNNNTGPLFAALLVPPVPAHLAAPCSYPRNHIYQPQTLTAPGAVKHPPFVWSCNVFHGPQSGACQPHTCYLGAKRKGGGVGLFVSSEFIISALFPIFLLHFSISHFLSFAQITAINQVHVLNGRGEGESRGERGKKKERKRGKFLDGTISSPRPH